MCSPGLVPAGTSNPSCPRAFLPLAQFATLLGPFSFAPPYIQNRTLKLTWYIDSIYSSVVFSISPRIGRCQVYRLDRRLPNRSPQVLVRGGRPWELVKPNTFAGLPHASLPKVHTYPGLLFMGHSMARIKVKLGSQRVACGLAAGRFPPLNGEGSGHSSRVAATGAFN